MPGRAVALWPVRLWATRDGACAEGVVAAGEWGGDAWHGGVTCEAKLGLERFGLVGWAAMNNWVCF
jgi:hypothetical protein